MGCVVVKTCHINSIECITARHLFESAVGKVADALQWETRPSRCETVSQLTVELSKMLKYTPRPETFRFVLVFDGVDRQRDAPATLLPALARLAEIVSPNTTISLPQEYQLTYPSLQIPSLTTVFIVTSPPANFLRTPFVTLVNFPNYTKPEFVTLLAANPPPALPTTTKEETADLWTRFTGAVHDALARSASRTLPALRHACTALWPRFTAPVLAGTHGPREFSKLLFLRCPVVGLWKWWYWNWGSCWWFGCKSVWPRCQGRASARLGSAHGQQPAALRIHVGRVYPRGREL